MSKYPYSKQAVKLMLATALVATPLSTALPFVGDVQINHAQANEQQVEDVAEKLYDTFYKNLDAEAVTEISDWDYPSKLDEGKREEFRTIVKSIHNLIFSNYDNAEELKNKIDSFRENNRGNFDAIFGEDKATTDDFIELLSEIIQASNDTENLTSFLGKSYDDAVSDLIDSAVNDDNHLNQLFEESLGLNIAGFINYLGDLNEQIDTDGAARSALFRSAVEERSDIVISTLDDVETGDAIEPAVIVNRAGLELNVANSFNWYIEDEDGDQELVHEKGNSIGSDVTFSVNSKGEYDVIAKLARNSSDDAEIEIARIPLTVEADSSSGGGSGGGGGGGSTPPTDDDQEDPADTPPEDTYDDERVTDEDGTERVIRYVDEEKLSDFLNNQEEVERIRLTVETDDEVKGEIRIPNAAIKSIQNKNSDAIVEIESPEGTVQLPVSTLVVEGDSEAVVRIAINTTTEGENVLEDNQLDAKSPIVDFQVSILSSNGEERQLNHFDKHVIREITGSEEFGEDAVVIRLNDEEAGFVAAPTLIEGSTATFKTQHFSKYVVIEHEKTFVDVPADYWAKNYFDKLGSRFIFQGRSDNTVAPGENMRRAQFAALIVRSLGLSAEGEYDGTFKDVDPDDWFTEEIQPAIEQGIIQGRKDGTFAPNDRVTRQQAAAMLSRAMEITGFNEEELDTDRSLEAFDDKERIGDWAKSHVERLMQAGVIDGREMDDGRIFDPKTGTSRAQMAKMLHEYLIFIEFMD